MYPTQKEHIANNIIHKKIQNVKTYVAAKLALTPSLLEKDAV